MTAFIDQARISGRGGDGGDGAVAWRREKFVPKGGPAGGDGGDGGSVILEVDEGLSTLLDFRYRHEHRASSGERGGNKDMYGKHGEDTILRVPGGTMVYDDETSVLLADLRHHGERFVVARGGKGGRGNIHFATPTDRAPRHFERGTLGQERVVRLELKLLADVGLVGFPNAGKSTLISRISAARPKVADYPFTTLEPHLGVVALDDGRTFVVADIPGLIEGAHEGHGLGTRFLRHMERTRVLAHLVDVSEASGRDPVSDFDIVMAELANFSAGLAAKPMLVVATKLDAAQDPERLEALRRHAAARGLPFLAISSATGQGIPELIYALAERVFARPAGA